MLKTLTKPIQAELQSVEQQLKQLQQHDNTLISDVLTYVFNSNSKRLRPILMLLACGACNIPITDKIINLATAAEVIHTATLLHDDVVDNAETRHGKAAVSQEWDNKTAILVGDFLYSKAFELLIKTESLKTLSLFAKTTHAMASGEVEQLNNRHNLNILESDYFRIIGNKTAELFAAAAKAPAVLTQQPAAVQAALTTFGFNTGIAFQLVDDIFDYEKKETDIGKPTGQDLATGQLTLPAILALKQADASTRSTLHTLLLQKEYDQATQLLNEQIKKTGSIEQTKTKTLSYLNTARDAAQHFQTNNTFYTTLNTLTEFVTARIN